MVYIFYIQYTSKFETLNIKPYDEQHLKLDYFYPSESEAYPSDSFELEGIGFGVGRYEPNRYNIFNHLYNDFYTNRWDNWFRQSHPFFSEYPYIPSHED